MPDFDRAARPSCFEDCSGELRSKLAAIAPWDVTVSTEPPIVAGFYTRPPFICPHGVAYWMEPTGEQIAEWAVDWFTP